jgi:aminoglycoside 3-N-acetyltransferase
MTIERILNSSPWVEVLIKYIYWNSSFINALLTRIAKNKNKRSDSRLGYINFESVIERLKSEGVLSESTLIVHSSASALKPTGLSPTEICQSLINLVKDGTLVMPAIPYFREDSAGIARLSDCTVEKPVTYDVQKSKVSTGALPQALLRLSGAIRSSHPLNTVVALGSKAEYLVADNLSGDLPLPCGNNSPWKKCYDQDAMILFLGIDAAHSLTMIHVAEDSWADRWPVDNWYRDRDFQIINENQILIKTVRERRPKWSVFYAERTLQKDLISNGICKQFNVDGLHIELISSRMLIEFLNSKRPTTYPYFIPSFLK